MKRLGWGRIVQDILKAFTCASSLHSKLRTLGIPVADVATVDARGMCLYAFPFIRIWHYDTCQKCVMGILYTYRRGLRSCLSLQGGKFEGQECEISNEYESHAFFVHD